MTKGQGHVVVGILGLCLAGGYAITAINTLPLGVPSRPGPAAYPLLVAVILVITSIGIIWERASGQSGDSAEPFELPKGADLRRLLGVIASIIVYLAILPYAGHLLASSLLAVSVVRVIRPASWLSTIVTGLAISISAYVLFVLVLGVQLPKGVLG